MTKMTRLKLTNLLKYIVHEITLFVAAYSLLSRLPFDQLQKINDENSPTGRSIHELLCCSVTRDFLSISGMQW